MRKIIAGKWVISEYYSHFYTEIVNVIEVGVEKPEEKNGNVSTYLTAFVQQAETRAYTGYAITFNESQTTKQCI